MPTARIIVNTALRKLGVLAAGREARLPDQTDALAALQSLYGAWIASGAFGRLCDVVPTGSSYVSAGNERILRNDPTTDVVLPQLVDEGPNGQRYFGTTITVDTTGNTTTVTVTPSQPINYGVPPRDGSAVVITDTVGGQTNHFLYDGTIKQWQQIEILEIDDEAPRSVADPQGLAACLAMEIADSYGDAATIGPSTQMQAARYTSALTIRYGMREQQSYQPEAYL